MSAAGSKLAYHGMVASQVGRYALYDRIAAGGMATVHYGRLLGPAGFSRTVAIKRLHPQFAGDPEFVAMFLDEARLAARVRHPNVVQTIDVVVLEHELFLVMEFVQGEALSKLARPDRTASRPIPLPILSAVLCGALHGLHAAHEAKNENGEPLNIVHRDVSPQNILVGADGIPRVIDFGVAKAAGRVHSTRDGQIKGKLGYMAPEQLHEKTPDRRVDVYSTGVVLWELLTSKRLFTAETDGATLNRVLHGAVTPPTELCPDVPPALSDVCMRALDRDPAERFQTAREMALALEQCVPTASQTQVADWVETLAGETLTLRAKALARIERDSNSPASIGDILSTEPGTGAARDTQVEIPVDVGIGELGSTKSHTVSLSTDQAVREFHRAHGLRRFFMPGLLALAVAAVALSFLRLRARSIGGASATQSAPPTAAFSLDTSVGVPAVSPPPPGVQSSQTGVPDNPVAATSSAVAGPMSTAKARHYHPPVTTPGPTTTSPPQKVPAPPTPSAGTAETNCTIRSYLDESGIKHFVKECP